MSLKRAAAIGLSLVPATSILVVRPDWILPDRVILLGSLIWLPVFTILLLKAPTVPVSARRSVIQLEVDRPTRWEQALLLLYTLGLIAYGLYAVGVI